MSSRPLISVVDDDDSVRESLSALIRSLGFRVMVFSSGEGFLHSDHPLQTDCLILDVHMPRMNGIEVQRALAAKHFAIPVIFFTGDGDAEARTRALKDGAVECLLKPFSDQALLNAIDRALNSDGDPTERHNK